MFCIIIGAQYLLYFGGRHVLVSLQHRSISKMKFSFFWAISSISHIFNIYMAINVLVDYSAPFRRKSPQIFDSISCTFITLLLIISTLSIAFIHSKSIAFPIPRIFKISTKFLGSKQQRLLTLFALWGMYISVVVLIACAPVQILLVSANPHLNGFTILTVWCVMLVCIIIASIPFTIDQAFHTKEEYTLSVWQAFQQILWLAYLAILVFGFGSLTFSIVLILYLSKYGEKTQSVSTSVYFVTRHVILPIVIWIARIMMQKYHSK